MIFIRLTECSTAQHSTAQNHHKAGYRRTDGWTNEQANKRQRHYFETYDLDWGKTTKVKIVGNKTKQNKTKQRQKINNKNKYEETKIL